MRYFMILFFVLGLVLCFSGFAQEQIIITTYYPSPFGVYRDLEVHNQLTLHDPAAGGANAILSSDATGNVVITSTAGAGTYSVIFEDSGGNNPLAYLVAYSGAPPSCPAGYAAVSYLDGSGNPYDNEGTIPDPGSVVCLRAQ